MTRTEMGLAVINYFKTLGRITSRSEYMALGANAPVHYRLIVRNFGSWHQAMKRLQLKHPTEWKSIFDVSDVYTPEPDPRPVLEPVSDEDLSPLEKLRASTGESSE